MTEPIESVSVGYPALAIQLKTGNEPFLWKGKFLPHTMLDFWRWSASDLVNNALRGKLAEFIVAQAVGLTAKPRVEWESYDLMSISGIRIEVKSSAYLQSWYHKKLSSIKFMIRPTFGWDVTTNRYEIESKRQSDIYVFCLLSHQDKQTLDPLNMDQWSFFVLATSQLDQACSTQKSISLHRLIKIGAKELTYETLADGINNAFQLPSQAIL